MHIVVCIKQVPRDNSVAINSDLTINAEGIEQIMNLFDEYAVEEALRWNEQLGGTVTVLSLGPEAWKEQLRRALAMGATDALLLSDPAFAELDVLGAARAVAAAVGKLGDVDIVICGRNSTDDESGAFAPALARTLGWPQLTYVGKIVELDEGAKRIVAERHLEEQVETVEAPLPMVVTVVKDLNEPRYPSLLRIKKVAKVEIPTWGAADLGLSDGAPVVRIASRIPPPSRPAGEIIVGADTTAKVRKLVEKLVEGQVI
jgi:electron transfer flavoprotein beta subunit